MLRLMKSHGGGIHAQKGFYGVQKKWAQFTELLFQQDKFLVITLQSTRNNGPGLNPMGLHLIPRAVYYQNDIQVARIEADT
jgi:hypothetical protein